LVIGFLIWYLPSKIYPQFTARTFIRVLPEANPVSIVALIKSQNAHESLVDKDEVQQTKWFQRLGKTKDERMAAAVADLRKRLRANALPESDLVAVSMTCREGGDAAAVVNEMAGVFLKLQQTAKRKQITADLSILEQQQNRLQRDLDLSEQALNDVRRRYGFTDLDEHSYPDPVTIRLMDLQKQMDNCALEKNEVQTRLEELKAPTQPAPAEKAEAKPDDEVKKLQTKLRLLQVRFAQLQAMRDDARKSKEELDLARAQYALRKATRDERRQKLDSIKSRIEELKIAYDNPYACGVQFVADAAVPRQADTLPWQNVIPTAAAAGAIVGIIHLLLAGRIGKASL
jgi:uncharacterized protein involved in exopolysaccharide biosynthesis